MALWTDMSPTGYERQVATNILFTHVFSGFTLWELIVSLPYDWKVFRGRRGCKWGAWIFYLNSRYLFMCSVVATLVFVDLFASKLRVVTGLGLFFQISGHVAAGFSYGILALRMMIIWRRDAMTLLMIVCQLALWAMTFAAFPHIIDGWQEQWSHIRLTTTLLVVTSIMLLSDYLGLVTAYRYYLARLKNREGTVAEQKDKFTWFKEYCAMLWQEGLQYFVIVWLAQIAEATVRFLNVDQSGLLRFTVEYAGLTATIISACRVYQDMILQCDTCPFNECRIFWRAYITRKHVGSTFSSNRSPWSPGEKVVCPNLTKDPRPRSRPCYRWKSQPSESDQALSVEDASAIDILLNDLSGGKDKMRSEQTHLEDASVVSPRTSIGTQSVT